MNKNYNSAGYVYILTNPSFREDWVKIGKSSRPVDVRSKELDNTAVPLPFEIFATMKTVKFNEVEKLVHKTIDRLTDLRIRQNREFFNVPPQIALDIFNDIALTIDDAEVVEYEDNKPIAKKKEVKLQTIPHGKTDDRHSNSVWLALKLATMLFSTHLTSRLKWLLTMLLSTTIEYTSYRLLSALSCQRISKLPLKRIKDLSSFLITERS